MRDAATDTPGKTKQDSQLAEGRLLSVDALRGFDMFWIVGAGTVVKALENLESNAVTSFFTTQLSHVQWEGFHFYDLIFPLFLFIVGSSIVFSLDKAFRFGGRAAVMRRVFVRSLLLFLLGILYYGGFSQPWPDIRFGGVLHRIAACYFFGSLIYTFVRSTRGLLVVSAVLLAGYWALLTFVPVPDLLLARSEVTAAAERAGSDSPLAIIAATESRIRGSFEEGRNLTNFVDFLFLPGQKAQTLLHQRRTAEHSAGDRHLPIRHSRRTASEECRRPTSEEVACSCHRRSGADCSRSVVECAVSAYQENLDVVFRPRRQRAERVDAGVVLLAH